MQQTRNVFAITALPALLVGRMLATVLLARPRLDTQGLVRHPFLSATSLQGKKQTLLKVVELLFRALATKKILMPLARDRGQLTAVASVWHPRLIFHLVNALAEKVSRLSRIRRSNLGVRFAVSNGHQNRRDLLHYSKRLSTNTVPRITRSGVRKTGLLKGISAVLPVYIRGPAR